MSAEVSARRPRLIRRAWFILSLAAIVPPLIAAVVSAAWCEAY
jgi:hypothetical protein